MYLYFFGNDKTVYCWFFLICVCIWQIFAEYCFFLTVLRILVNCLVLVPVIFQWEFWLYVVGGGVAAADWTCLLCYISIGVIFHIVFYCFLCFQKCYISSIFYQYFFSLLFRMQVFESAGWFSWHLVSLNSFPAWVLVFLATPSTCLTFSVAFFLGISLLIKKGDTVWTKDFPLVIQLQ